MQGHVHPATGLFFCLFNWTEGNLFMLLIIFINYYYKNRYKSNFLDSYFFLKEMDWKYTAYDD